METKTTLIVIEWGNGNTDVFIDMDDLKNCYNDDSEISKNATELATEIPVDDILEYAGYYASYSEKAESLILTDGAEEPYI